MKIIINYDSCWRNSFLDGDNNSQLPPKGRKYIASIKALGEGRDPQTKKSKNFIERRITQDTVMGVLNRLIGDQGKLYQSRASENYYFSSIEDKVSYEDRPQITQEMTYLRNISNGIQYDPKSFTGSIIMNDVIFNSDYTNEFWGVLSLNFEELCQFIVNDIKINSSKKYDPLTVVGFYESLKIKPIVNEGVIKQAIDIFWGYFQEEINYFNAKKEVVPLNMYCSALYLQLGRLEEKYDMSSAKTPSGGIKGISKRLFTKKDFMEKYVSGGKKIIYGNPYIHKAFVKGEGETKSLMTKASGQLEINLDISRDKAKEIKIMIENAGVSSFYLGKKGLAYISKEIDTREFKR
jgi:hypothetical protein